MSNSNNKNKEEDMKVNEAGVAQAIINEAKELAAEMVRSGETEKSLSKYPSMIVCREAKIEGTMLVDQFEVEGMPFFLCQKF